MKLLNIFSFKKFLYFKVVLFIFTMNILFSNPKDLIKNYYKKLGFDSNKSYLINMDIINYKGNIFEKAEVVIYSLNKEKAVVKFLSPEKYKNDIFLKVHYNSWFYREGLKRPLMVAQSQKLYGNASVSEVAGIDYYSDYEVLSMDTNEENYRLNLRAVSPNISYPLIELWISKETGLFTKAIIKVLSGLPFKEVIFTNYKSVNGFLLPEMVIKDLQQITNKITHLIYRSVEARIFPENVFQPMLIDKFERLIK